MKRVLDLGIVKALPSLEGRLWYDELGSVGLLRDLGFALRIGRSAGGRGVVGFFQVVAEEISLF